MVQRFGRQQPPGNQSQRTQHARRGCRTYVPPSLSALCMRYVRRGLQPTAHRAAAHCSRVMAQTRGATRPLQQSQMEPTIHHQGPITATAIRLPAIHDLQRSFPPPGLGSLPALAAAARTTRRPKAPAPDGAYTKRTATKKATTITHGDIPAARHCRHCGSSTGCSISSRTAPWLVTELDANASRCRTGHQPTGSGTHNRCRQRPRHCTLAAATNSWRG